MKKTETLADKMSTILLDNIFNILKRTKDNAKLRACKIAYICNCCCNVLTINGIKKEDKIDIFENLVKKCVDDIDKAFEEKCSKI